MKIGVLINDVTRTGGTEKITSILTDIFVKKGHDVTIISCNQYNVFPSFEFNKQIKIEYLDKNCKKRNKIGRVINYLKYINSLKRILKNERFNILLCQSFPMSFIGILATYNNRVTTVIACEHTSYEYYSPAIRSITNWFYRLVPYIITINSSDKERYKKYCKNVCYIPNIVNIKPIESKVSHDNHTIVSVGRLEYHKGFDRLIYAMAKIVPKESNWKLLIYGDGPERNNLQVLINKLNLEHNIILQGTCTNLSTIYSSASLYVLPSRIEGFGLVLVEAASFGLPLISFDCPSGPRDILHNDGGLLIEDGNIEKLSSAILYLIDNKAAWQYYHHQSSLLASKYSYESIYPLWNKLFEVIYEKNTTHTGFA